MSASGPKYGKHFHFKRLTITCYTDISNSHLREDKTVIMILFLDIEKQGPQENIILQPTFVISKLKGPSETLRDIRTSKYQIFRIEENTNGTTKFTNEYVIRLL